MATTPDDAEVEQPPDVPEGFGHRVPEAVPQRHAPATAGEGQRQACRQQLHPEADPVLQTGRPTIDQALERADRLRAALVLRNVHPDVLRFCTAELLDENFFHAVFEAMKSITAKLRQLTGATTDGADLVHAARRQA